MASSDRRQRGVRRLLQGRRDWRLITWFILAFNVLMLLWLVGGLVTTVRPCTSLVAEQLVQCQSVNGLARMQAMIVLALWTITDVILGAVWLVTRPREQSRES